jgi:hypothetical protein
MANLLKRGFLDTFYRIPFKYYVKAFLINEDSFKYYAKPF